MSQIRARVEFLSNNNHRDHHHHPGDLRGQVLVVDGLEVYLVGFWDTVNHIKRTYSPIEEDGIPLSYAYRAIREWDQVAKETLDC